MQDGLYGCRDEVSSITMLSSLGCQDTRIGVRFPDSQGGTYSTPTDQETLE